MSNTLEPLTEATTHKSELRDNTAVNPTTRPQMTLMFPKSLSHKGHGFLAGPAWLERAASAACLQMSRLGGGGGGGPANSPASPCTTVSGVCWPLPALPPLKAGKGPFSRKFLAQGVHPALSFTLLLKMESGTVEYGV